MNPHDGELLAVANWPRVDANNRRCDAPAWARQNRAVQTSYEPGSTFKAFTMAGALEDGKVTPEHDVPAARAASRSPTGRSARRTARATATLTASQIIKKSSNVGTIKIGLRLGETRFDQWVRQFGFGKTTGVDLPGEQTGIVLPRSKYSGSSMGNLPIGQGEAVTPMQMATAYCRDRQRRHPAPAADRQGGRRQADAAAARPARHLARRTREQLRTMLEGVLGPGGTASGAAIQGYVLAGKTGTAEKPDPVYGGYSETKFVASFVGLRARRRTRGC